MGKLIIKGVDIIRYRILTDIAFRAGVAVVTDAPLTIDTAEYDPKSNSLRPVTVSSVIAGAKVVSFLDVVHLLTKKAAQRYQRQNPPRDDIDWAGDDLIIGHSRFSLREFDNLVSYVKNVVGRK